MTDRIFDDAPDAVERLTAKLEELKKEHAYWKALKPEKRTYGFNETDGMKRWYMLPNLNQQINGIKKRIAKIEARKAAGVELERKVTFKNGRKVFWYSEVKKDEN